MNSCAMPAGLRAARRRRAADVQHALHTACIDLVARHSSKPNRKFIIEMTSAIARVGTVVVRDCARVLSEVCKAAGTVEKRLSAHLQDPALWHMINFVILNRASPAIQVYTPIAIDPTDSQRRHAVATPGVEGNYDGSAGAAGRGYTHLCAAAIHLADNGRQRQLVPLLQDTFGLEHETAIHADAHADNAWADSTFQHYQKMIKNLSETLGGPIGIDVMDRGMDDKKCFGCELDHRRWFVIRLCDTRRYVRYGTMRVYPQHFYATTTARPVRCLAYDKRRRQWRKKTHYIDWVRVGVEVQHLDGRVEEVLLTLLIVKDRKQRRRMLLLTNLTPDDEGGPDYNPLAFATMLFQAYLARWGIETCFDLLKNEIEVETIRARTYVAAQNLFALAWLTLSLLCQLHALAEPLCQAVLALYQRLHRFTVAYYLYHRWCAALAWLWTVAPIAFSLH